MAYCFRFRTTRAISTWPQKDSKPHTSAATAERSLKNSCFFSCHTNYFVALRAPLVPARLVAGVRATLALSSFPFSMGVYSQKMTTAYAFTYQSDLVSLLSVIFLANFGLFRVYTSKIIE